MHSQRCSSVLQYTRQWMYKNDIWLKFGIYDKNKYIMLLYMKFLLYWSDVLWSDGFMSLVFFVQNVLCCLLFIFLNKNGLKMLDWWMCPRDFVMLELEHALKSNLGNNIIFWVGSVDRLSWRSRRSCNLILRGDSDRKSNIHSKWCSCPLTGEGVWQN